MQWFKSVWMRLRKSTGLAGNEVLVPMVEKNVPEVIEKPAKPKRIEVRKKKNTND